VLAALICLGISRPAAAVFGFKRWQPIKSLSLGSVDIRPSWESAWVRERLAADPAAEAIVASYLAGLSSAGYERDQQGVWIASGPFPVAQYQGEVPRSAASLTKVATTLAALATWGPTSHFETLIGWQGQIENGVLIGDLIVEGGEDPLFVWEEAIALGNTLQQLGIRQVSGNLIVTSNFTMNFETSPAESGQLLKQAMNVSEWDYAVERSYLEMPTGTPQPSIAISGQVQVSPNSLKNQASGWLVSHQSLPLIAILKAMNIYSNNPMSEQVANTLGGPAAVMRKVTEASGIAANEISIVNGSGLGEENRISPRATVTMMQTIQTLLRASTDNPAQNFTVSDIFPIAGADGGTVQDRGLPQNAVVKTGTLAVVSALAGAFPTQNNGVVWFSLLNYGSGLDTLRSRQDQVLSALEKQWGRAAELPPELQTTVRIGVAPYQFGDSRRNQIIDNPADKTTSAQP